MVLYMIELAYYDNGLRFSKLEYPYELDKLKIGKFEYFNKHLGMSDYMGNFSSWLKRPSVTLIVGINDITIVGWVMTERWKQNAKDGRPIYVLRAIEVSPAIARKGIGKVLFLLSFKACIGHMLTKPVNSVAKAFFLSLGFQEPGKNCPVDLSSYPGYLFLPEGYVFKTMPDELNLSKDGISECQKDISNKDVPQPRSVSSSAQNDVAVSAKQTVPIKENVQYNAAKTVPKTETGAQNVGSQVCTSVPETKDTPDPVALKNREFLKEHKMMSQCACGEYMTHKYVISGKSPGYLFICAACGKERYFLKG